MTEKRYTTFEEFWPYYVGEHRVPLCRALHYCGTTAAVVTGVTGLLTFNPFAVVVAPFLGYGPAWVAHFFVEHNRPATFTYPLWSLRGDFKMLGLALRGKMADEVTRLYGSPAPTRDAPLLGAR